jgi:hypothetical protein
MIYDNLFTEKYSIVNLKYTLFYFKQIIMQFGLVSETSFDYGYIANFVDEISDDLNVFFGPKYFGNDIASIIICVISVSPEFDDFMKPKKPKYSKGQKVIENHGVKLDVSNSLRFDVKFTSNQLQSMNSRKDVEKELYGLILENLDVFRNKI